MRFDSNDLSDLLHNPNQTRHITTIDFSYVTLLEQFQLQFTLQNYHGKLDRLESRRFVELYNVDKIRMLKTSYRCKNIDNRDFLTLAVKDFHNCQTCHQKELQQLERWYKNCRLDKQDLPIHYLYTVHFLIASTLFQPQFSEARITWTQCAMLVAVVDNLFDVRCSQDELLNLTTLAKRWDEDSSPSCFPEQVQNFFSALQNTVDDQAKNAQSHQDQCVRQHLISLWQELINNMMKEVDWGTDNAIPTMDEYLSVACLTVSNKLVVLSTIYFVGEKLAENWPNSAECRDLWWHTCRIGRLNNDLVEIESSERVINSVTLQLAQQSITEKEAKTNVRAMVEASRRELLQMVVQKEENSCPRLCKDVFWLSSKVTYYLYSRTDELKSPQELYNHINAIIYDPIKTSGE